MTKLEEMREIYDEFGINIELPYSIQLQVNDLVKEIIKLRKTPKKRSTS